MDWQGQSYNFLLNFAKYNVNYEQRWTNYKLWTDFGETWTKTASYYSSNEMLEEITEPCYKFLWWQIEQESQVNFTSPSQSYPQPQPTTSTVWWFQCDKVKYVASVNLANLTYIRIIQYGICFSPDGANLYVIGEPDAQYLFWFTLTTPWDITTAKFQNKINLTNLVGDASIRGVSFSPDGQIFYTYGDNMSKIVQFYLSKPWDITTLYSSGKSVYIRPLSANSIRVNPYGTKMYISSNGQIVELDLLTLWDVSTADKPTTGDATLSLTNIYLYDFSFKSDGSGIYVCDNWGTVYYCDLSTPWSLSNYIYKGGCFSPASLLKAVGITSSNPAVNFLISSDGKFAYMNFALYTQIHMFTSAT